MKVLVLGDSITKGVIFDESKQKYVTIENGFVKKIAESFEKLTIDNLSLMGSTVTRGMTTLERLGDELESYDYTVIEFGGNDCDFDWAAVAQDPTIDHQSKTPIMLFKQTYSSLIEKIQSHGSKPIILSLPPIDAQKYFDWVSNGKNSDNILKFLGDKQHIARWQQMYNLAALDIARKKDTILFDITTPFLKTTKFEQLYCRDGIHPNIDGQDFIFESLNKLIANALKKPQCSIL